jgi:hypothetical protein
MKFPEIFLLFFRFFASTPKLNEWKDEKTKKKSDEREEEKDLLSGGTAEESEESEEILKNLSPRVSATARSISDPA